MSTTDKTIPAAGRKVGKGDNNPPVQTREQELQAKHAKLFERRDAWLKAAKKLTGFAPKTAEDCAKLNKHFADGRDLLNDADGVREVEKKPFFLIGKEIDATFNGGIRDQIKPLAEGFRDTAAARLLALTREQQAKDAAEATRVRLLAEAQTQKAAEQESKGEVRLADATTAGAEAIHQAADRLETFATADVGEASKAVASAGGVKASVTGKMVCDGVNRAEIDLEALRPYLKQTDLIAAANAYLAMGNATLRGAIIVEKAVGRVGR